MEGCWRVWGLGVLFLLTVNQVVTGKNTSALSPPEPFPCSPFVDRGTRRPGNTSMTLLTSSAEDCCNECFEHDPGCLAWTRQRSTGLCALKSDHPILRDGGDEYDSGSGPGIFEPVAVGAVANNETVQSHFECPTQDGKTRSGTALEGSMELETPDECCLSCDNEPACHSWSFNKLNGTCALFTGLPDTVDAEDFITGEIL